MTFKERVVNVATAQAPIYKSVYIDYDYLICSNDFKIRDYYILSANEDNYQHLIGVNTPALSANDFFTKCLLGNLVESDFDFNKPGKTPASVKGSVRRKIRALPFFTSMIGKDLIVQEGFQKNKIICSFATTDHNMTIGYINNKKAIPKSLMLGDMTDCGKAGTVDLILRKKALDDLFSEVVFGDETTFRSLKSKIEKCIPLNGIVFAE